MRKLLRVVLAVLLISSSAHDLMAAQLCPPRFKNAYFEHDLNQAQEDLFWDAMEQMYLLSQRSDFPAFRAAFKEFSSDVVAAFENPAGRDLTFDNTLQALMRSVEKVKSGPATYTADAYVKAITAANGLRTDGILLIGVIEPAGTPGSSSWLSAISNRGNLFETVALRNLIQNGYFDITKARGLGFRMDVTIPSGDLTPLEGDAVQRILGGERWIDFKAANAEYKLAQLEKARVALLESRVREFAFAHEVGTAPGPNSLDPELRAWWQRLQAINAELGVAEKAPIQLVDAGTF